MFDEDKVKKDLEKMRKAYEKAMKDFDEIEARQKKIAEMIYGAKDNEDKK
ncbi:MAG: hypothetical protein WC858_06175 [Parcubacteria group bacterium]|jgi:hypothetical protein